MTDTSSPSSASAPKAAGRLRGPLIIGTIASLLSVFCYASSQVVTRNLLTGDDYAPQVGSAITLFVGMLVLGAVSARNLPKDSRAPRSALVWVILAGILASTGAFLSFFALSYAPVVLASPIFAISPLITLFLAAAFLRQVERITLRVFLGAFLVIAGVILVILSNQ